MRKTSDELKHEFVVSEISLSIQCMFVVTVISIPHRIGGEIVGLMQSGFQGEVNFLLFSIIHLERQ